MHLINPITSTQFISTISYLRMVSIIILLFISMRSSSQVHIYKNFGVDDGLPSSEIYDVYQDKEGYIWFATDKGLSRYNGYEFENFNTTDGIAGNVVLKFYPQENGQVWCYTFHSKSLFYFDEVFNDFHQYEYNEILNKTLGKSGIVKSVSLDEENNLHVGGLGISGEIIIQNNGIIKERYTSETYFSDSSRQKLIVVHPISDSLKSCFFLTTMDINPNNNGLISRRSNTSRVLVKWLVDNEIAIFMNGVYVELVSKNHEEIIIKNKYSPIDVTIIDEDHFFIGYEFGGGKIVNRNGLVIKEFLSDQSVTGFLMDHEGGYWLTTLDSGVFYIKNPNTLNYNSNIIKSHHINSLIKTNNNDLFAGFIDGTIAKIKGDKVTILKDPKLTTHAIVEYDATRDRIYTYSNSKLNEGQDSLVLNGYILKISEPKDRTYFVSNNSSFHVKKEGQGIITFKSPFRIKDVCVWNKDTLTATPMGLFKFQNNKYIPLSEQSEVSLRKMD